MFVVAIIPEGRSYPYPHSRGSEDASSCGGIRSRAADSKGRSRVRVPSTRHAHGVGPATRRRLALPISALDRKARPTGSHICVASKKILETSLEVSKPVPV